MACAAANRVRVSGDGQFAVRHHDDTRVHASGSEAACDLVLHLQEVDRVLAHVPERALLAVPVARVRREVDVDLIRAVRHGKIPVGRAPDTLAIAIEVVEPVCLARRRASTRREVHIRITVAVPTVAHPAVTTGGEARAIVEDGIGGISIAVVVAWSPVAFRTRAGVVGRQCSAEVELCGDGCRVCELKAVLASTCCDAACGRVETHVGTGGHESGLDSRGLITGGVEVSGAQIAHSVTVVHGRGTQVVHCACWPSHLATVRVQGSHVAVILALVH